MFFPLLLLLVGAQAASQPDGVASAVPVEVAHAKPDAPLRMPDMPLHDPWIVADDAGGTYHLFTRNEPAMTAGARVGVMAYNIRDLKTWQRPRLTSVLPEGIWANDGAWGPQGSSLEGSLVSVLDLS